MEFTLYSYFRSSASYRARIALNLKGIKFEYRAVHLLNDGGEQFKPEYVKLNPSRDVPTLVHKTGGREHVIGQSMAIIDYLDTVLPAPLLFPKEPMARALAVQACEIVNSGVQPVHNLRVLKRLGTQFGATEDQKNEWTTHWLKYGLDSLESFLKPHAGKFAFGDQPSAPDCFVMPNLFNADRFKVSLEAYPVLQKLKAQYEAHPAFQAAHPSKQPDTPKES